jgi:signal transduction histidine kinase
VAPVEDGGDLFGAVAVLHDLTEERALKQRLELADRLAAVGTLAAGVAHEISNPLTFVKANVEFALGEIGARRPPGSERLLPALEDARDGASRVERIVSELRSFTQGTTGRPVPVELRPALEWAVGVTSHLWHGRAEVRCDFGQAPRVAADPTRLGQVFVNLLSNAAQAIAPGPAHENAIRVSCRAGEDGTAVAEVADTGAGIPPEVLRRIFEPFFTTKAASKGTGLGLAISHDIVQSMGGRIEVESTVGKGSLFRVILPAAGKPRPASG